MLVAVEIYMLTILAIIAPDVLLVPPEARDWAHVFIVFLYCVIFRSK